MDISGSISKIGAAKASLHDQQQVRAGKGQKKEDIPSPEEASQGALEGRSLESLISALKEMPDARADKVRRARQLFLDEAYPSKADLETIAKRLLGDITEIPE